MPDVTFIEKVKPIAAAVGKWLLRKEFEVADIDGEKIDSWSPSEYALGILYDGPDKLIESSFLGLIKTVRKPFIGVIYFDCAYNGANEKKWVFELYGRKYFPLAMKLAKEMAVGFNVDISLQLVREDPEYESFESDFR